MGELSGGNYQRVALAMAMVNDPELLLLDEPTTGLDPGARRLLWDVVREIRSRGRTVILTTHYMDEAEALCDRIGLINGGRMVRCGPTAQLLRSLSDEVAISFRCPDNTALSALKTENWCKRAEAGDGDVLLAYCTDIQGGLAGLLAWASRKGYRINDIATLRPTLDDLFLQLVAAPEAEQA